jgi:hypothetical protein
MKKLFLELILFVLPGLVFSQNAIKGVVFEDLNKNGKKDKGEIGLANVSVSNGTEVVATDSNGNYVLPACNNCIIFVIKPSTHEINRDETNHPANFYIHKPEGSPSNLTYKGSMPTGNLPEDLNFPLYPSAITTEKFQFLVFGDPQPYTMEELGYFEKVFVPEAQTRKDILFGISLGDLVGDNLDMQKNYKSVIKKIGKPWYGVMGNHDMNYDVKEEHLSDETFEANFGPATYAFNYGNAHFIVLDNILYPDPRDGAGYWGGLRGDQLKFVENDLKYVPKDKLVVLFMHIPIYEENSDSYRDGDRRRLLELIAPYKNSVSFSAHTHFQMQSFFDKDQGFENSFAHHHHNVGTPSGDWYSGRINTFGVPDSRMRDGTPKGHVLVTVDGTKYSSTYKAAEADDSYQMEISNPKVIKQNQRTSASIVVNFFMGSSKDTVRYRIDNGEWKLMQNYTGFDIGYLKELFAWDDAMEIIPGRRPSNPEFTNHLWRSAVPVNLEAGEHIIEVEATDMFGKKHLGKSKMEVRK